MPPRWLSLAIIVFWLGTSGWFFWRDLWPQWRPGEPPPYRIDLVEEAQRRGNRPVINYWTVTLNDRQKFDEQTWVEYHRDDDTFSLKSKLNPRPPLPSGLLVQMRSLVSTYHISREERLLDFQVTVGVRLPALGLVNLKGLTGDVTVRISGEVRGDRLYPHYLLDSPLGEKKDNLRPVEVSYHGSVLQPYHPVNRIQGLRRGQTWRLPLMDPLGMATGFDHRLKFIDARVLDQTRTVNWQNRDRTCLVIEYQGDDASGSTWVEESSGRVLRQEFSLGGNHMVMQRD